jgi:hypothetical protein
LRWLLNNVERLQVVGKRQVCLNCRSAFHFRQLYAFDAGFAVEHLDWFVCRCRVHFSQFSWRKTIGFFFRLRLLAKHLLTHDALFSVDDVLINHYF